MADKLDKDDWSGFVKKHKLELDDKALVKALSALDKAGEDKPDERAKALSAVADEIKKMVPALAKRKKELGDKPFGLAKDKLYALLDLAESGHKAALDAAAEAKRTDTRGADDDEDDNSPDVLTTKMVPLIRQLKKGDLRLPAMIGSISKTAAVLISKRSISNTKRKLLNEALDAAGGVKYAKGECYYETGTLHFVMSEGKVGGLAKRVRAALLEQTGFKLKVKLRGEDGEEDGDGEEEGDGPPEAAATAGAAPGATPGPTAGRPAPQGGPASADQLAYAQRLKKVRDRLMQALKAQHPEATKLRGLIGFSSEKAAAKDFAAAGKALDMIDKLLGDVPFVASAAEPAAADGGAAPGRAGGPWRPLSPIWEAASESAIDQTTSLVIRMRELEDTQLDRMADDLLERVQDALEAIDDVLDELDGASPEERIEITAEALALIRQQQSRLSADRLITAADTNPLGVRMTLGKTLGGALDEIAGALGR